MSLDSIINLVITTATKTPSQRGFGTPMIVGYHTAWPDRVREYSTPSDMLSDGFTVNAWEYKAAVAVKRQNPAPRTFKIGRRASAPDRTIQLTPTNTTQSYVYSFTIVSPSGVSTAISYTNGASETVATICTALQALVAAITGIDCADNTTHITVTATTPGDDFQITGIPYSAIDVEDVTADPGLATDLNAILAEDSDFYAFCIDSYGVLENAAASAWAESLRVLFVPIGCDSEILDSGVTDDQFSALQDSSYARSIPFFHDEIGNVLAPAMLGSVLPFLPGSQTWAFKTLAGVPVATLSGTEESTVNSKGGNYYTTLAGSGTTYNGQSSAGEFADVTRGVDWLFARIQEAVIGLLQNNRKVPFTTAGAGLVRGAIQQVLKQGVKNGFLAAEPAPTTTVPAIDDVSAANRAARHLPDVEFTARLAGAIHTLDISGVVSA